MNTVKALLNNYANGSTKEIQNQGWCLVLLIRKNDCGSLKFYLEEDPEVTSGLNINEHSD